MHHKHGGDIYSYDQIQDFSANINDRGMPESVRIAAEQAVRASVHYPDPAYRFLRHTLAGREDVREEQIICGNGAAELMFALAAARRPCKAFLAVPSFFEYEQALSAFGCEICRYTLQESDGFALGESFLEHVPKQTDIMILGNPNNPTGRLIPGEMMNRLFDFCSSRGIFLVMDESFFDFLSEEDRKQTVESTQQIDRFRDLMILKSFTKMYAMPGLRFGYAVCGNQPLLESMRTVMQPWNVSIPAQMAAQAAAAETGFAKESARRTAENRLWMKQQLESCGYRVYESNANFLLFCDRKECDLYQISRKKEEQETTAQPYSTLQEFCLEHGYLIRDCSNFPGLTKGYYRVCVRSQQENEELLAVLRMAAER